MSSADDLQVSLINVGGWIAYQRNGVFARFINEVTLKREIALPVKPGMYNYCAPVFLDGLSDHLEDLTK